jgi:hypothetical protein
MCTTSGEPVEKVRAEQTESSASTRRTSCSALMNAQRDSFGHTATAYKHVGRAEPVTDDVGIPPHAIRRSGGCGTVTTMGRSLSETYARDPSFYGATFCCGCNRHLPVAEFVWTADGQQVGS